MYEGESYQAEVEEIRGCTRCNLHSCRTNIVIYRGNPRSNIMVIGEAPGSEEDRTGKPFVGPTGSYFVEQMARCGLSLKDYYITNTLLCRPPNNDDPKREQLDACEEWLYKQIRAVKPQYIIAAGRYALARLDPAFSVDHGRITSEEGKPRTPPQLRGAVVIPVRHPSAARRNPDLMAGYERMLSDVVARIREDRPF